MINVYAYLHLHYFYIYLFILEVMRSLWYSFLMQLHFFYFSFFLFVILLFNSEKLASWNLYLLTWSIPLFIANLPLPLLSLSYSCCDPPCWVSHHKEVIHPHIAWASAFTLVWTVSSCDCYPDSTCAQALHTGLPFHQHPPCLISAPTSYAGRVSPSLFCGYPPHTDRFHGFLISLFFHSLSTQKNIWKLKVTGKYYKQISELRGLIHWIIAYKMF